MLAIGERGTLWAKVTSDSDVLTVDRLATERARRALPTLFADLGIPGHHDGELFHFDFGGLVGRVEIMKSSRADVAHAHMTLSSPLFAAPVMDCWMGMGDGPAEALDDALRQWASGAYLAYHDALAHDDDPTYEVEIGGMCWHVFEAPLVSRGGSQEVLERTLALGPTRQLLSSPELRLSRFRAHRLRWVAGAAHEVLVDDELMPELTDRLRAFQWPSPVPPLLRHSAVLLPHELAEQRQRHNVSLDDADAALRKAGGLVDANERATVLAALQHGLELQPTHPRAPQLCMRWAELERELRPRVPNSPFDVPISRSMLLAYAAMAGGSPQAALFWLDHTTPRSAGLREAVMEHVQSLAYLFAEHALPERTEALVHSARSAAILADPVVRTSVSSLEAPSAVAVIREVCPTIEVSFAEIPDPDPRLPHTRDATVLWTYRPSGLWAALRRELGTDARPMVPAPSHAISQAIAALASRPYSRAGWHDAARETAAKLGDHHIRDLLGVMVHPPQVAGLEPWDARFAVMCASAFVLARLEPASGPESAAGKALIGLIDGPVDWTVTAAVIALVDWALRNPDVEPIVCELLLQRLYRPMSPIWYMCFYEPASWLLLRLPSLPSDLRAQLAESLLAG